MPLSRALLVLRETAEERVDLDLLTPNAAFAYRQMEFASLFSRRARSALRPAPHRRRSGGDARSGSSRRRMARRAARDHAEGKKLPYDSLLIAIGARLRVGVAGAITIGAPGLRRELMLLIDDLERGLAQSVAFAAPGGVGWLLPLYELALMIATRLENRAGGSSSSSRPEEAPLEVFGAEASRHVEELLHDAGSSSHAAPRSARMRTGWSWLPTITGGSRSTAWLRCRR